MNTLLRKSLLAALAAAALPAVGGEPSKPGPTVKPGPQSVFVMPSGVHEGRDPFFPESQRPYEDAPTVRHAVDATIFTYSGTSLEQGHRLAIINNHSFAVGDEGDVRTSSGRVHLRVISIGADTVVIEVNGTRREIKITDK